MKNFLKQFVGILMGILFIGSVFAVVSQRNNSKNEISQKRILFTDTGLPGGDPIIDVNTGGNTISYGPLLDGLLNPYITGYSETDPVFLINSGNYYPLAGNSISNPITGPLYMAKGSGAFNLEVLTGQNVGLPMTVDVPVLTPTAFLTGVGIFKIMLTKGRQFFMGEPGENTQMYLANSTGDIGWKLDSNDDSARFKLQPFTGGAMNGLMGYTQWNVDGTIQAGNTGIITAINAGPAETYVTKGYVSGLNSQFVTLDTTQTITGDKTFTGYTYIKGGFIHTLDWMGSSGSGRSMDENGIEMFGFGCNAYTANSLMSKNCITALVTGYNYIPRTSIDTGFNNTGSDTIIPSEKAIYSLFNGIVEDLGDVLTTGGYYISGTNQRRTVESGNNYSIEYSINGGLGRNQSAFFGFGGLYGILGKQSGNGLIIENQYSNNALLFLSNTGTNGIGLTSRGYRVGVYGAVHTLSPGGYGVHGKTWNPNSVAVFADSTRSGGIALKAQSQTYTGTAIETVGAIVLTGNTVSRRLVLSGDNLSFQAYTGGVWVEKHHIAP